MTLLNRENYADHIARDLAILSTYIQNKTKLNLTDSAVHAENFFRDFFNLIFNYDLNNVNLFAHNYPAIDLADQNQNIAIQVTASPRQDKFQSTLSKFCEKEYYLKYNRLLIVCIGENVDKKIRRSKNFQQESFQFSYKDDLWDISTLLELILDKKTNAIKNIYEFLGAELETHCSVKGNLESTSQWPPRNSEWNHETTEDDLYVPRDKYLTQLDGVASDLSKRIVSITGMGGTGKTSLMGHWLKQNTCPMAERNIKGLFYWSFYAENNVGIFLQKLWKYLEGNARYLIGSDSNNGSKSRSKIKKKQMDEPIDLISKHFSKFNPIVLALDGLEVVQETLKDETQYGAFIDLRLRDLIFHISQAEYPWLCVMTSRFPISDFASSRSSLNLNIAGLTDDEGSLLLLRKGVYGDHVSRQKVTKHFEGHPLALLLFSSVVGNNLKSDPIHHLHKIFEAGEESKLEQKMVRLLDYYQKQLDRKSKSVVMVMSIFRAPIPLETISTILPGILLRYYQETILDEDLEEMLHFAISTLSTTGILIVDNIGGMKVYACHPVVRDYFRAKVVSQDSYTSKYAVDLLNNRPDELKLVGVSDIEPYILAIELLTSSTLIDNFHQAISLHRFRLDKGLKLLEQGLANEGKRCCASLLRAFDLHYAVECSDLYVEKHSVELGLMEFHYFLGEYEQAIRIGEEAKTEYKNVKQGLISRLLSKVYLRKGCYRQSLNHIQKAVEIDESLLGTQSQSYESLALDYYILTLACAESGLKSKAKKSLASLESNQYKLDSKLAGFKLLSPMASLKVAIYSNDLKGIRRNLQVLSSGLPTNISRFIDLECELMMAHGYLINKEIEKSMALSENIRKFALKKNLAYEYCYSSIIHLVATGVSNKSLDEDSVLQVIDDTADLQMTALQYQAILFLSSNNEEVQYLQSAEEIEKVLISNGASVGNWFS